jgi:hypothetical protein
MLKHIMTNLALLKLTGQDVPGRKVSILGGHSTFILNKKLYMYI